MTTETPADGLANEYHLRFDVMAVYRDAAWKVLRADYLSRFLRADATVLTSALAGANSSGTSRRISWISGRRDISIAFVFIPLPLAFLLARIEARVNTENSIPGVAG